MRLGIGNADKVITIEMEMKMEMFIRSVEKLMILNVNDTNLVKVVNTWAVSLLRHPATFLNWTKNEFDTVTRNKLDRGNKNSIWK